jgi:hypothetical protein
MTDDLYVKHYDRQDERLGRVVVHDPRSRAFALTPTVDKSTWHSKSIRIYDPTPNPNQVLGDCTGCAKSMMMNSAGNRVSGVVLKLKDADKIYSLATTLDPWAGSWPPDDTGSSGLAAAKAAQRLGLGGTYRFIFGGADEVVQAVMDGHVVNVGSRWDNRMFDQDSRGRIHLGGGVAGGHEWTVRGYDAASKEIIGRCWWGEFKDFRLALADLAELLADDGDAHVQERTKP